jgi:uncharacterized repeat protein (TIGR01451 family)
MIARMIRECRCRRMCPGTHPQDLAMTASRHTSPPASRRPLALALAGLLVAPMANASMTVDIQTSNPAPVVGGTAFGYTVVMTNPDGVAATNVVMTDPMPPGINVVNMSIAGPQAGSFSCTAPPLGTNGTVACRATSLAAGGTATVSITAQTDADMAGGNRTNTARIVAGGSEALDSVMINLQNNANLSLSLYAPDTARAGDPVTLLASVNNSGHSSAINALLNVPIPAGTTFVGLDGTSAFSDTCSYDPQATKVVCDANHLPTGFNLVNVQLQVNTDTPPGAVPFSATLGAGVGSVTNSPTGDTTTIVP